MLLITILHIKRTSSSKSDNRKLFYFSIIQGSLPPASVDAKIKNEKKKRKESSDEKTSFSPFRSKGQLVTPLSHSQH